MNLVIAVDGPAGAGKSTISKLIAKKLGINYIDTGAMYRALTLKCLNNHIDVSCAEDVIEVCKNTDIRFADNSIYLDGKVVDDQIRTDEVNKYVSQVSLIPEVRAMMVDIQRKMGESDDVILDGRDIGTTVFPNATFKFFLVASAEERGRRRLEQMGSNCSMSLDEVIADIKRRDDIDSSRSCSPLVKADDAIEIDTTHMTIDEVVDHIVKIVNKG